MWKAKGGSFGTEENVQPAPAASRDCEGGPSQHTCCVGFLSLIRLCFPCKPHVSLKVTFPERETPGYWSRVQEATFPCPNLRLWRRERAWEESHTLFLGQNKHRPPAYSLAHQLHFRECLPRKQSGIMGTGGPASFLVGFSLKPKKRRKEKGNIINGHW